MTPTPTSLEDLLARITGLRVKARTFAQETLRTPALRRIEYVKQLGYTDPIEALLCFRENTDTLRTALDTAIGSKNYRGRFFQTTGIRTAELEQFCRHKGIFFTKEGVFAAVRKILPTKAISKKLPRWSKFFELKKD